MQLQTVVNPKSAEGRDRPMTLRKPSAAIPDQKLTAGRIHYLFIF